VVEKDRDNASNAVSSDKGHGADPAKFLGAGKFDMRSKFSVLKYVAHEDKLA
jgi:hypothetical protein